MPRSFLLRIVPLTGACLSLSLAAAAQSVNIDVSSLFGTPSNAYGAGAAQPGFWNTVDGGSIGVVFPLKGLSGATTGLSVSYQIYGNGAGNFSFNEPSTFGDDEALMDDLQDIGSGTSLAIWTFAGLNPGNYTVYTYAWAPDDPINSTSRVRVNGSPDPEQSLGGPWPGSQVKGVTYAQHAIAVGASGLLVIEVQPKSGFGSVNGIQLVEGSGTGPAKFCTSKPSSVPGCVPTLSGPAQQISKTGGPGSYDIDATPVPGGGGKPGILIYTKSGLLGSPATTPFGFLCLNQFLRAGAFPALPGGTNGACDGSYVWDFGSIAGVLATFSAGDTLHIQAWYRDPLSSGTANFTQGIGPIAVTP